MVRPCFLVLDRDHAGSISTRKLVIETEKMNVITAYSSAEAIETLQVFSGVHGAVLDGSLRDMACEELVKRLREIKPGLRIVVLGGHCGEDVHHVSQFDPHALLTVLRSFEPEKVKGIQAHQQELAGE